MNIRKALALLPYLHKTIYFNFHYLPFKQAIHLPIWLYKPKFKSVKGSVQIMGGVKIGMIRLGFDVVNLYPSTGILIDNQGAIVFKGQCIIGNNSFLSIGRNGILSFGKNFSATTSLKLACYDNISFGNDVSLGWNCLFSDTDFHCMKDSCGNKTKGYGAITIGNGNWFGNNCIVLKNSFTNDYITVGAGTTLSTSYLAIPSKSIIINDKPVIIVKRGVWRDMEDDDVTY